MHQRATMWQTQPMQQQKSQGYDDLEGDDDLGGDPESTRRQMTPQDHIAVRQANRKVREAEERAAKLERDKAFLRIGVDPDNAVGIEALFVKAYDGPLTQEALIAEAVKVGVLVPTPPSPQETERALEDQAALEAQQRINQAAVSGQTAAGNAEDQTRLALQQAYKEGGIEALTDTLAANGIQQVTR